MTTQARLPEGRGVPVQSSIGDREQTRNKARGMHSCHLGKKEVWPREVHLSQEAKPGSGHLEAPGTQRNREAREPESGVAFCPWAGRPRHSPGRPRARAALAEWQVPRMRKRNVAKGSQAGAREGHSHPQRAPSSLPNTAGAQQRNAGSGRHPGCRIRHRVQEAPPLPTASSGLSLHRGTASRTSYSHGIHRSSQT